MKKVLFFAFCFIVFAVADISAQRNVPAPLPAAELEIREGSIRLRSIDLERVKRDANKTAPRERGKEQAIKFALVKEDFENIQKSQDSIIKAYTTGKEINYEKIGNAAHDLKKHAHRLAVNLFNETSEETQREKKSNSSKPKSVRDLIIELDNALGVFIANPIFQNVKIVEPKASEKAQNDLKKIYKLSDELSREAAKMKQ